MHLWINAICIDQTNPQEKSAQVQLTPEIYASVKSVIVWLDPNFQGVAKAFRIFPYLTGVAAERYETGKPETLTMQDFLNRFIAEVPLRGPILRSKEASIHVLSE